MTKHNKKLGNEHTNFNRIWIWKGEKENKRAANSNFELRPWQKNKSIQTRLTQKQSAKQKITYLGKQAAKVGPAGGRWTEFGWRKGIQTKWMGNTIYSENMSRKQADQRKVCSETKPNQIYHRIIKAVGSIRLCGSNGEEGKEVW